MSQEKCRNARKKCRNAHENVDCVTWIALLIYGAMQVALGANRALLCDPEIKLLRATTFLFNEK